MAYTTIKKPSDYFNTKLYTGNGATGQSIIGVGFQPDLLWIKNRDVASHGHLMDIIRGSGTRLATSSTDAEATENNITSFDSDGFTIGTTNNTNVNGSGNSLVSWNWLASNTTASNTDGSISSTVSVNTTSGFSIVSYTGNGTAGATVGHGLGTAPSMIIQKARDSVLNWKVYHKSLGATQYMNFDETNAVASNIVVWNNTEPTSSVYSLGSGNTNTSSVNYIAYCFAEKQGFSKFGSYTGNGNADGTFVYTGFKPAFVLYKATNLVSNWLMYDSKRPGYNDTKKLVMPNLSNAEADSPSDAIDLLSNGFKFRGTGAASNGSGNNFIYMAFAEEPLVGDNPATAR